MGYYVTCESINVVIPADKVSEATEAARALAKEQTGFSWVDTDQITDPTRTPRLPDIFHCWRFATVTEENGDVRVEYFEGEKLGDEQALFAALAPFIVEGGYVYWRGEEGEQWRWVFSHGKLFEQDAKVVWPDIPNDPDN